MASLYPDMPSIAERQLMSNWLDMFRDTITCPNCKDHFTDLLASYRAKFPGMLNSKKDFMYFTFRAHNSVNARLHKPVYRTVQECMDLLKNNVKDKSASVFRVSYINHIRRHWRMMRDTSGISALKKLNEMSKIENEYASSRSNNFDIQIPEDNVVLPGNLLSPAGEPIATVRIVKPFIGGGGIRFTAQGLRLRR
jgi:hypothetical protein